MKSELSRNDPCWCGSGKKYKKCHMRQIEDVGRTKARKRKSGVLIKTPEQIEGIRKSGQLTKSILDRVEEMIRPGITTLEINEKVHQWTLEAGAYPAPLNYRGFPKSVCTSLNHVICHGIPDKTVIKDGDILNVDVTCILDGYYGDSSRMFLVGNVSEKAKKLVVVTKECLDLAIDAVRPGTLIGTLGAIIQEHAEKHGFSVVRDFAGHGTGVEFHEEPQVLHYGKRGTGLPLVENMTFTIEPMINEGGWESKILADGWTAVTRDGSLSAQWEHTLLVTRGGVEILTG